MDSDQLAAMLGDAFDRSRHLSAADVIMLANALKRGAAVMNDCADEDTCGVHRVAAERSALAMLRAQRNALALAAAAALRL